MTLLVLVHASLEHSTAVKSVFSEMKKTKLQALGLHHPKRQRSNLPRSDPPDNLIFVKDKAALGAESEVRKALGNESLPHVPRGTPDEFRRLLYRQGSAEFASE